MTTRKLCCTKLKITHILLICIVLVASNVGLWLLSDFNKCSSSDGVNILAEHEKSLRRWEDRLVATEQKLRRHYQNQTSDLPVIYVITPTYSRPVQKAELTRLQNTLTHVLSLHWILVEDAENRSELVGRLLQRSGLSYTHLSTLTPPDYKLQPSQPNWMLPRGVLQRNAGLAWLRNYLNTSHHAHGVLYFADDDNTYDLRIFEEMRFTQRVSVWPVGLAGYLRYERPVLDHTGHVVGWFTAWKPHRKFAVDMAGFAVSTRLLTRHRSAEFSYSISRGEQESFFLSQLVDLTDLEPKANNCTEVLVWHTRTQPANLKNEDKLKRRGLQGSDPKVEV